MAKEKSQFVCSDCGGTSPKWLGKCPACGAWNSLVEGIAPQQGETKNRFAALSATAEVAVLADIEANEVAASAQTVGYELMCALAARVPVAVDAGTVGS